MDDPMGMLVEMQAARSSNPVDRLCEKVAGTKTFDSWAKNFCKGDLKAAEKDWGIVLHQLKSLGAKDCTQMASIANERTILLDSRANPTMLLQHLLAATKDSMGPRDRYTADCYKWLARQNEGAGDYARALDYRKMQASILLEKAGKDDSETVDANKFVQIDSVHISRRHPKSK